MAEQWHESPSHPCYAVSDQGRIKRLCGGHGGTPGRILATPIDSEGYPTVNIGGRPRRVHVLVAEAFIAPIAPGSEVHHWNEDRSDARATNLRIEPSKLAHGERHRRRSDLRRHAEDNPVVACACGCGSTFTKFDRSGRPRRYVSGHNLPALVGEEVR